MVLICLYKKRHIKGDKFNRETLTSTYCLSLSLSIVFVMTLYGRDIDFTKANILPQLFNSYVKVIQKKDMEILLQMIMNVLIFIPFGFCLPWDSLWFNRNKRILYSLYFCTRLTVYKKSRESGMSGF